MRKIKVLHILNTGSYAGAENIVIAIIQQMKSQADGIYLSKDGNIKKYLEKHNIPFYPVDRLSVPNIRRAIQQIKPDIIHAHGFRAGIMSTLSTHRIPIINHVHSHPLWAKYLTWQSLIFGISCIRYKRIITVSNSLMIEYYFGNFFLKKTISLENPIDIPALQAKAQSAQLATSSDIIFLGRCASPKNPLIFINIIKDLAERLPEVRAVMIGDGELFQETKKQIQALGLDRNIHMYGFLENPYGLLHAGKILCMPSSREGFPLAALEALALGKPVVASPVGGLNNIVTPECGKLCRSPKDFAEELFRLLTDKKIYQSKSNAALERANKFRNLSDYTKTLYDIYCSVLSD